MPIFYYNNWLQCNNFLPTQKINIRLLSGKQIKPKKRTTILICWALVHMQKFLLAHLRDARYTHIHIYIHTHICTHSHDLCCCCMSMFTRSKYVGKLAAISIGSSSAWINSSEVVLICAFAVLSEHSNNQSGKR